MSKHHTQQGQHEEAARENIQAGQNGTEEAVEINAAETREAEQNDTNGLESIQCQTEAPAGPATEPGPEEKIAALEAQLADTRDQLLRKAADFENFRKRMNQEKQNAIDFANQSLLLDIIPVIDDFERAIQSAESSRDFAVLFDGITMIEKRLVSQLESKWGLKRYNSAGEPFDPNKHEALMMDKSADVQGPQVQEDLVKGYMLKDRVIRAAKVKVLMPDTPATVEDQGGAE